MHMYVQSSIAELQKNNDIQMVFLYNKKAKQ